MAQIIDCTRADKFLWIAEATKAFHQIKEKLTKVPILAFPNFSRPFELHCDAFKVGIGPVLSQNGKLVA